MIKNKHIQEIGCLFLTSEKLWYNDRELDELFEAIRYCFNVINKFITEVEGKVLKIEHAMMSDQGSRQRGRKLKSKGLSCTEVSSSAYPNF